MGFNTSVLILNDALGAIEADTEFGKRLVRGIRNLAIVKGGVELYVPGQNVGEVVETHRADGTSIVAFGGNYATKLYDTCNFVHHTPESRLRLLKEMAADMGYKLIRLSAKAIR